MGLWHINLCRLFNVIFWPFDPAKNAIPRWSIRRRWHILMAVMRGNRVGGNWLMKWDELKKFPWYTHRLMHRKRVTCELLDSYFRLMTIKHAISKDSHTRPKGLGALMSWGPEKMLIRCSQESHNPSEWAPGPPVEQPWRTRKTQRWRP